MVYIDKTGLRGNILNIIRSMYSSVISKIKYQNQISDSFECNMGVRQGECLSLFLFLMLLNDIEDVFMNEGVCGLDIRWLIPARAKISLQFCSFKNPHSR